MEIEFTEDNINQITDAAATKGLTISEFIIKNSVHAARTVNISESNRLKSIERNEKKNGIKLTECCSNCCRVPVNKKRHCEICTECWSEYCFSGIRKHYKQSAHVASNKEHGATKRINQASSRRHHD